MMWALSPISLSPMFGLHRQCGTFRTRRGHGKSRLCAKLEMEAVKKARRDRAHERGQVPQEVWLEIIEHDACGERPECIRNADGESEHRHISAAHVDTGECCRERLARGQYDTPPACGDYGGPH